MKKRVSLTLSTEVLKKVDTARGLVQRSTYLDEFLNNTDLPPIPAKIPEGKASNLS